jgi:hypothetical protein
MVFGALITVCKCFSVVQPKQMVKIIGLLTKTADWVRGFWFHAKNKYLNTSEQIVFLDSIRYILLRFTKPFSSQQLKN